MSTLVGSQNTRLLKILEVRGSSSLRRSQEPRLFDLQVIHLGDQLESVNTPRARDVEALKLMRHFEEFLSGEAALSPIFNDNARLHEAADVILKLQVSQAIYED